MDEVDERDFIVRAVSSFEVNFKRKIIRIKIRTENKKKSKIALKLISRKINGRICRIQSCCFCTFETC